MLAPGTRVGSYEIRSLLGSGGMGEVYRAADAALGRDVALKVISGGFMASADQHARFEREARALAALNHPNIAAIYGFLPAGDSRAIVMELVEGETLAERLARGPMPIEESLTIARQIAAALEAAHDGGIVHRDLKPSNIRITPANGVKVLDFGLAKSTARLGFDGHTPTMPDATREGSVVGTAAYMSPEQARGQAVDSRTDIWAFGCVLFEMLTGRSAFTGATTSDIIANVLQREPEWQALPDSLPAAMRRLLRRTLQKDVHRRLHHIADVRLDLDDLAASPATAPTGVAPRDRSVRWTRGLAAAGAFVGLFAAGMALERWRTPVPVSSSAAPGMSVFGISEPSGEPLYLFADPIKLSPDGRQLAMIVNSPTGQSRLWIRSIDEMAPHAIENTGGAMFPFWSPDGRSLGFISQNRLCVLDVATRAVRTIAPAFGSLGGGTWNRDGTILFVDGVNGIKRVAASGGPVSDVVGRTTLQEGMLALAPQFLPDGRHFLYYLRNIKAGGSMMVGDLQSAASRPLPSMDVPAIYAHPGYLLFSREGVLAAQRFDSVRLELRGEPAVVGRDLFMWLAGAVMAVTASENGTLAFASRRTPTTQLTWYERSGRPLGTLADPGLWIDAEISPDQRMVAAERLDMRTGTGTLWSIDIARAIVSRITADPSWNLVPRWSRRGDRIAFGSSREGAADLWLTRADGSGGDAALLKSAALTIPTDWLPGDTAIVFDNISGPTAADIFMVPLSGDRTPKPVVQTTFSERSGRVSPNGRWLAYVSNESGNPQVYVRPFDSTAGRRQISRGGGSQPRWRRDGQELFFLSESGRIMAVQVTLGVDTFDASIPVELPVQSEPDVTGWRYTYDAADNGGRFLVIKSTTRDLPPPITVVVNWLTGLR